MPQEISITSRGRCIEPFRSRQDVHLTGRELDACTCCTCSIWGHGGREEIMYLLAKHVTTAHRSNNVKVTSMIRILVCCLKLLGSFGRSGEFLRLANTTEEIEDEVHLPNEKQRMYVETYLREHESETRMEVAHVERNIFPRGESHQISTFAVSDFFITRAGECRILFHSSQWRLGFRVQI